MSQPRIGELLSRLVGLDEHDVDEILQEQSATRKRFGEIALSWGLCRPEHIWQAWSHQLNQRLQHVSLLEFGIDAQATLHLSRLLARKYQAVPIRFHERQLIVAVTEQSHALAARDLPRLLGKSLCFVLAESPEIEAALNDYYPALQRSA
jgi:hypothetical protein